MDIVFRRKIKADWSTWNVTVNIASLVESRNELLVVIHHQGELLKENEPREGKTYCRVTKGQGTK